MKKHIVLLTLMLASNAANAQILFEGFDGLFLNEFARELLATDRAQIVRGEGAESTNALKVYYKGFESGSERVLASQILPNAAEVANLEFKVRFCEGFDFANGGKLHGMGPTRPVTNGNPVTPDGWSARLMFTKDGGLMTYIYHQDMKGKFGDSKRAPYFRFETNRYYQVKMVTMLNTQPALSNGKVEVFIDGEKVISHEGIRFRLAMTEDSMIRNFMFNTFHGGSTKAWAPIGEDGMYATECAYFDDFSSESLR